MTIPKSVTDLGYSAFYGCTGLGLGIVVVDGCLLTVNGGCPADVVIGKDVRLIVGGAFSECENVQSVTIDPCGGECECVSREVAKSKAVDPLPDWACDTFTGDLGTEDESVPVTVTIGSSGKVSGKYTLDGATWTFSASSLSSAVYDETTHEPQSFAVNVTASATISRKKKSQKLVVTVMEEGVDIQVP